MADVDAALVQKVFYITKRERISDIHQHAKLDDLRRSLEVAKWILVHLPRLTTLPGRLKASSTGITRPRPRVSVHTFGLPVPERSANRITLKMLICTNTYFKKLNIL